ncbi:hypothetical protein ABI59_08030 [Acidobacteria bacterium Mor1]|nr:hypothetical protein ABI59_08030 [Acidobacteria bacterium Mor1]
MVEGGFEEGSRINEVALAEELQVSRTPLREALSALTAEGFLENIPRRGFFVLPLSTKEFLDLYAMRAILDPAALESAGLPSPEQIEKLEALNEEIKAAVGDADRVIELDDRWHLELVGHGPNDVLINLICQFIRRTRRYEQRYLREAENVAVATGEHERIIERLRADDLEGACAALRANMQSGLKPILAWLQQREKES